MQDTEKTLIIKNLFDKYRIDVLLVVGGEHKKNYNVLKPVLGLKEILHISYDGKEREIHKYIKKSDIVVTVPFKRDIFKYYIKKALRKYPKPYIHTYGGSSSSNIIESLYNKKDNLELILQQSSGEI